MRISDGSSDVCSSALTGSSLRALPRRRRFGFRLFIAAITIAIAIAIAGMLRPIFGQDDAKPHAARIAQTLQRAHDAARGDTLGITEINHTLDRPSAQGRVGHTQIWPAVLAHRTIFTSTQFPQ